MFHVPVNRPHVFLLYFHRSSPRSATMLETEFQYPDRQTTVKGKGTFFILYSDIVDRINHSIELNIRYNSYIITIQAGRDTSRD